MGHDRFIVVFKKTASEEEITKTKAEILATGGEVIHNYDLLNGFAATIEPSYLLQLQSSLTDRESAIEYIEPDSVVTIQ